MSYQIFAFDYPNKTVVTELSKEIGKFADKREGQGGESPMHFSEGGPLSKFSTKKKSVDTSSGNVNIINNVKKKIVVF